MPPSTGSVLVAKYSVGVGNSPTSTAAPPAAAIPSRTPCASAAPDGRLSRPTATRGGLPVPSRSQANVVYACPTARAAAGVSCSSTRPRMSYWRKIVAGGATTHLKAGLGGGVGGLAVVVCTRVGGVL